MIDLDKEKQFCWFMVVALLLVCIFSGAQVLENFGNIFFNVVMAIISFVSGFSAYLFYLFVREEK